jgi:uncharacterized metal-binding protein YceD (DUF177 family)
MTEELEFSRLFDVRRLPPEGKVEEISATTGECKRIAGRFGVLAVESLEATIDIQPWKRDGFRARGTARAKVIQECVVTLNPFDTELTATLDRIFVEKSSKLNAGSAEVVVSLDDDDIAFVEDGDIELGELTLEELMLELDPYPRKPDAELAQSEFSSGSAGDASDADAETGKPNPFAVLKQLKIKDPE